MDNIDLSALKVGEMAVPDEEMDTMVNDMDELGLWYRQGHRLDGVLI